MLLQCVLDVAEIKLVSINQKYNRNFSLTKEYRQFKSDIERLTRPVKLPEPPYQVIIEAETYLDLTNWEKCIVDGIASKLGFNDRDVYFLQVTKIPAKRGKPGSLKVSLGSWCS